MFKQKLTFKNTRNLALSAIFEGEHRDAPIVVMCHGFESSKDRETNRSLAQKLIEAGLCVFRFDFTGHGQSEGTLADITPLQGLDDLKSAVKNLKKAEFALYGSSFGGYVALLYATENPILALALKAPVSDYSDSQSSFAVTHPQFIQEVKTIDFYDRAQNIKCPCLIIHGDKDDVVSVEQSQKLFKSLKCDKRLEIISGADHDIRGVDLEKANTLVADFFKQTLL